jgi:hypothetical protein
MMQTPSRVAVVSPIATALHGTHSGEGLQSSPQSIPTVSISPARQRNECDRFLAQKKAREIIMYAFLLFAGSRNASRKTKKSKKDKAYASV